MVAIERGFAATSRGAVLIDRIKADPRLTACEIRVVAYDSDDVRVSLRSEGEASAILATVGPGPAVAPLDQRGTRREQRFKIVEGIEVQIDGNAASLVNLSTVGAQVVSPVILKPNQHIRFTLVDPPRQTRCRAAVAWAALEIPKGTAHYRAGIEFFGADQESMARFIQTNKK